MSRIQEASLPQNNYLPFFRATYPILAPFQKPGGVAVGTVLAVSSIAWATGVATVTTAAPIGAATGSQVTFSITGCVPAGYNGLVTGTVTGASTFTYPLAANPGALTTPGTAACNILPANATPNLAADLPRSRLLDTSADTQRVAARRK